MGLVRRTGIEPLGFGTDRSVSQVHRIVCPENCTREFGMEGGEENIAGHGESIWKKCINQYRVQGSHAFFCCSARALISSAISSRLCWRIWWAPGSDSILFKLSTSFSIDSSFRRFSTCADSLPLMLILRSPLDDG